ncbi:UNKNOWN [Stylonychia lemnae]|uniref:Uncharacterized protein n=1 Tax=Stylonychia lemnae TaxID=5949 RepID=A0A077ZUT8_STYLE|nr:UNKNOWN [Stylonychia lemnae]|eukprot:CDW73070.1 UNKNOWN [Stylonychia lemnae]
MLAIQQQHSHKQQVSLQNEKFLTINDFPPLFLAKIYLSKKLTNSARKELKKQEICDPINVDKMKLKAEKV